MQLEQLGWCEFFSQYFQSETLVGSTPARVIAVHRGSYIVLTENGESEAEPSGRLLYTAQTKEDLPVTGDWVALRRGGQLIDAVLPRRTRFARKQPGPIAEPQILAANIDLLFVVTGLDHDFNLRRLERYMVLAGESGSSPVIVLNKADLHPDPFECACQADRVAAAAPVLVVSAKTGDGMRQLMELPPPGSTVAFVGSSGAGKSSLVNRLLGTDGRPVQPVRQGDSHGRHTTVHRELILLPAGWLVVDMPGIRELQLWGSGEGLETAFADVESLAAGCRFRDCTHAGEPGCAVRDQVEPDRLVGFHKLRKEMDHLYRRQDQRAAAEEKRRIKRIHKAMRHSPKPRYQQ